MGLFEVNLAFLLGSVLLCAVLLIWDACKLQGKSME